MGKSLASFAVFVVLVYAIACAFLWITQRGMIYFPTPAGEPGRAETLELNSGDATLRLYVVGGESPDALVYFGGNAENAAWSSEWFAEALPGRAVYLVNYRGYGGSSGDPSEAALYDDATTAFDFVKARHERVALMGRSLGSGVATWVASQREIDGLVLVTPFDSLVRVASGHYPIFPVSLLLKDRYESQVRVPDIDAPTLILIASKDRVIPPVHAFALAEAFPPSQAEVLTFEGVGHNDIESAPGYRDAIRRFLSRDP